MENGLKKADPQRNPKYVDIRMDEVFPAKKPRFKLPSGKENAKENSPIEQTSSLKKISAFSKLAAKRRQQLSCPEGSVASVDVPKMMCPIEHLKNAIRYISQCYRAFNRGQKLSGLAAVDMDKALKGLAACEAIPNIPLSLLKDLMIFHQGTSALISMSQDRRFLWILL
ncbi:uncharacterized protein [Gossypium hirsutum]|uniref:Uncharacterized protein n=1 Tax=Gossypium hirsutum TaxID=3635 RepID=A0ABM3AD86_GOSHI|nr:uncharacterized protein LOC121219191 [Gossypium hirsutum]